MCCVAVLAVVLAGAANPLFEGWYADPQIRQFGDRYWIYPTYSHDFRERTTGTSVTTAGPFRTSRLIIG